jgi:hypothetical protein
MPALASTVVNLNAVTNSLNNPVNLFLQAATYSVEPIGVSDGGLYNAWNAWGSTTCVTPSGCNLEIPTQVTGWLGRYDVSSLGLSSVSVRGVTLSPSSVLPLTYGPFFYDTPSLKYYETFEGTVFPDAIAALANAPSSTFTLTNDANVSFFIRDTAYGDNVSGMSLRVSGDTIAIPIPGTLWLVGPALAALMGFARRKHDGVA